MNHIDITRPRLSFVAYERRVSILLDRRSTSLVGTDLDDIRSGNVIFSLLLANRLDIRPDVLLVLGEFPRWGFEDALSLVRYLHACTPGLGGHLTGRADRLTGTLLTVLGNGERISGLDIRTRRGLSGRPSTARSIHMV